MENTSCKILIVGGGLTGCVAASLVKREVGADITIWEKENYIGGRMATFHYLDDPSHFVDLGCQYVTANLEFIRSHAQFYDQLLEEGVLVPFGNKTENFRKLSESKTNFVAPKGSASLVKRFLNQSGAKLQCGYEVTEINLVDEKKQWEVQTATGISECFDFVILTLPIPLVLKLKGSVEKLIAQQENVKLALEQVKYSSRYSFGLFYKEHSATLDKCPWHAKYFPQNDVVCFATIDNRKRGQPKMLPAVLIHTTPEFSLKHFEDDEDSVKAIVMNSVKMLLTDFPEPNYIKCQKWLFSEVTEPYFENPGCIVLAEHPGLITGGDGFTESNFNGCITSALKIVEELLKCVKISRSNKRSHESGLPAKSGS